MVYPVLWTAVCYVTVMQSSSKKLGWSVQIFGGPDPRDPPVVAPLAENKTDCVRLGCYNYLFRNISY